MEKNMSYLTQSDAKSALGKLRKFHGELNDLFNRHGMRLESNPGRRNVILSQAQEEFFAKELANRYTDVVADGKTGKPDIVIGEIGVELECKLTSPLAGGALNLQADEFSVTDDKPKDFLYVVNKGMQDFAVLHFVGLVKSDFIVPTSSRSKGKMRLSKHRAFSKCNVLVGAIENRSEKMLQAAEEKLKNTSLRAKKARLKLENAIKFWKESDNQISVKLVPI